MDYLDKNPNVKVIGGISSYIDYIFFTLGNQESGFNCFLLNTSNNVIDYLLTKNTVDDVSFTNTFSLLNSIAKSDSEDSFITYLYANKIIEGLNMNKKFSDRTNYKQLYSLFKNVQNIDDENPVLFEFTVK